MWNFCEICGFTIDGLLPSFEALDDPKYWVRRAAGRNRFGQAAKSSGNTSALPSEHQTTGTTMLANILNAIYDQFLHAAMPGIESQGERR